MGGASVQRMHSRYKRPPPPSAMGGASVQRMHSRYKAPPPPAMGGTSVQRMHSRYKGPPEGRYSVCTVVVNLDTGNCFTELVFCGLVCFPFGGIIF